MAAFVGALAKGRSNAADEKRVAVLELALRVFTDHVLEHGDRIRKDVFCGAHSWPWRWTRSRFASMALVSASRRLARSSASR